MFEHCKKYVKLLIPILLGVFFVTFVIDDYGDEPRKMKDVYTECISEIEADESEWEENDLPEDIFLEQQNLGLQETMCIFLGKMQPSPSKLSAKQFRGLVRRYVPRPISIDNQLFKNGTDLFQVCAIFYFENQNITLWDLQVF